MRIAVLADIHGNLPAFEAALQHVARHKVDRIVLAGDIVNGSPDSKACWDLAVSLGCPMLRGNHERYAAHFGTAEAAPQWSTQAFAPVQWAVAQLSEPDRQCMARLPLKLRLPDAPGLFFVHASERDDHDSLEIHTPAAALRELFPTAREGCIVRGHNHAGQVRAWEHGMIVTSGSVGLPLNGRTTAQYLLLDQQKRGWKPQHQSVAYDVDSALRRFEESGYLAAAGPMARLFQREVMTASFHIVPFLRLYAKWSKQEDLSLSQAVERFFSL